MKNIIFIVFSLLWQVSYAQTDIELKYSYTLYHIYHSSFGECEVANNKWVLGPNTHENLETTLTRNGDVVEFYSKYTATGTKGGAIVYCTTKVKGNISNDSASVEGTFEIEGYKKSERISGVLKILSDDEIEFTTIDEKNNYRGISKYRRKK